MLKARSTHINDTELIGLHSYIVRWTEGCYICCVFFSRFYVGSSLCMLSWLLRHTYVFAVWLIV